MDEFLCETWINVYKRIRFFSSVNRVSLPPMGGEEVGKIVHTYFDVCWSAARVRKKEKRQHMEGVGEGRMRGSGVAPRYCRRRRYATSVDPSIFVFNFHLLPALIARACLHACQRVEGVEGEYSRIFGFTLRFLPSLLLLISPFHLFIETMTMKKKIKILHTLHLPIPTLKFMILISIVCFVY